MNWLKGLCLLSATLLFGCAININNGEEISYQNHKIVSKQIAKSLPREQRLARITQDIQKVGFKKVYISGVFDTISSSALNIFKHQYRVMGEHKKLLDLHRDVLSFLMANQDKNQQQLNQAVADFDSTASKESEKIGPKIRAYQQASDKIWQENFKLSMLIAEQAIKLAYIIHSQGDELFGVQGIQMLLNADKLSEAYNLAEIRLHLAKVANEFIEDEKAIIDIAKQLQSLQDKH